tara:strand:+ start:1706 stop:2005 length:300 start_codon:yes stop_codon:yes gene_type:complete
MSNIGYEKKDIPVKSVAIGGVVFVITVVITLILLFEYYVRVVDSSVYEFRLSKKSSKIVELNESNSETLNSYKLTDKENQTYQIPIDRSKELLLNDQEK